MSRFYSLKFNRFIIGTVFFCEFLGNSTLVSISEDSQTRTTKSHPYWLRTVFVKKKKNFFNVNYINFDTYLTNTAMKLSSLRIPSSLNYIIDA
jgi:hypothetical protein